MREAIAGDSADISAHEKRQQWEGVLGLGEKVPQLLATDVVS